MAKTVSHITVEFRCAVCRRVINARVAEGKTEYIPCWSRECTAYYEGTNKAGVVKIERVMPNTARVVVPYTKVADSDWQPARKRRMR